MHKGNKSLSMTFGVIEMSYNVNIHPTSSVKILTGGAALTLWFACELGPCYRYPTCGKAGL